MILLAGIYYPSRVFNQKTHFKSLHDSQATSHEQRFSPCLLTSDFWLLISVLERVGCWYFAPLWLFSPPTPKGVGGSPFDIRHSNSIPVLDTLGIRYFLWLHFDIGHSNSIPKVRSRRIRYSFPPFSFILLTFSFCFPSSRYQLKTKHLKLKTISSLPPNVGAVREPP